MVASNGPVKGPKSEAEKMNVRLRCAEEVSDVTWIDYVAGWVHVVRRRERGYPPGEFPPGVALLGDGLTGRMITGAAITLAGVYIVIRRERRIFDTGT